MQAQTKNRSPTYQKISPTKKQQSFFRVADAVASLSDHKQTKLGCVLVDKHRIVSSGHNSSTRCSPLQKQMDTAQFGNSDKHRGPSTQRRPVYSLSFVRDTICPGQTCISSGATEMALWPFQDRAPAVCPSYEQAASGACFSASREVFLKKEFDRRYFARFVINIL